MGYKYEETLQDALSGEWYTEQSREEMLKAEPARLVIVYKMPESAVLDWLRMPGVTIATDSMPILDASITWDTPYEALPNTHPRGAGSCAKTLRLGRENNIPLMQSLAQLSYNSAKPLGNMGLKAMQERGRVQVGMIADITIFDPENVADQASFAQGGRPSTGIPYVLVNGTVVVKNSEVLKDVNPGQPIRFEPEANSRFEPVSVEAWKHIYTVSPVEFGGTESFEAP